MAWGQYLGLDLYDCDKSKIRNTEDMKYFVIALCKEIDMQRYKKTLIERFGEGMIEGYSAFQFIKTSSITIHFEEQKNQVMMDLFSCKEFNMQKVVDFTLDWYGGKIQKIMPSTRGK